jgi:hypothetical protein
MITLERTTDVEEADPILKHPDIFPDITDDNNPDPDKVDFRPMVENEYNYILKIMDGDEVIGLWTLLELSIGYYDIHTNILPEHRGAKGFDAAEKLLEYMFIRTPATFLMTRVPEGHKHGELFARKNGLLPGWTRKDEIKKNGSMLDMNNFYITIIDWFFRHGHNYEALGKRFHDAVERAIDHKPHDDDETHDQCVGVVSEMCFAGNAPKGAGFYNSLGPLLGYQPIKLMWENDGHFCFDIYDHIIKVNKDFDVQVLEDFSPCQSE